MLHYLTYLSVTKLVLVIQWAQWEVCLTRNWSGESSSPIKGSSYLLEQETLVLVGSMKGVECDFTFKPKIN